MPRLLLLALLLILLPPAVGAPLPADTLRTPGGVRYVLRQPGHGPAPGPAGRVTVHYSVFLPDGRLFESSATEARPLRLRLGRQEVIPGWEELLPLLPAGSRVWARVPAALAYGAAGQRDPDDETRYRVPPNTDLLFELEIVRVN
ncbi:FKBP-type peptidyl-prolyl cis-trans isomerase [Hymenobacter sp. B81]|uniref:FKBP-type peptidyl-prolyl cis-trans isomerase n=1 Tax=Hymenobacter sp. B81 TaxID=3344878 RepID=UPI0037DCAB2E